MRLLPGFSASEFCASSPVSSTAVGGGKGVGGTAISGKQGWNGS